MATPRGQAKTSPVCNPKPKSSDAEWKNVLKEAQESVAKATAAASADAMSSTTGVTVDFFKMRINEADAADNMPSSEATATAKSFSAGTDFTKGVAPKYDKGDTVWAWRKHEQIWKKATVVDTRSVVSDGYYMVVLENGQEVEERRKEKETRTEEKEK